LTKIAPTDEVSAMSSSILLLFLDISVGC
jgi:hypothetical protein